MKVKEKTIVITSALRTAIGTFNGTLQNMEAHELGSIAIKENIKKSKLKPDEVDEVIMGQVLTSASGQNPARQAAIQAGIPINKTAYIINQVCGSGLRSVAAGYQAILSGDSKIVIAGGQESMTNAPHAIHYRNEKKLNANKLIDTMIKDGLWDAFNGYHMGVTAENVAKKWAITRKDQDDFALLSQAKTAEAQKKGKFKDEIIPVSLNIKDKNIKFEIDEHPRNDMTIERLEKLKPSFKSNGTVTPGNASGINDGAAAVVLVSEEKLRSLSSDIQKRAVKISASILTSDPYVESGQVQPDVNTLTRNAASKAYETSGVGPEDLDLVELHDCFATAELIHYDNLGLCERGGAGDFIDSGAPFRDGKIPVNVSGGLISKGHPIGATGVANIFEITTHLRGEAGDRQIEGAKVGLAHVIGLGSSCGVHILEKSSL